MAWAKSRGRARWRTTCGNDAIRSRTDTGAGARGLYLAAVLEPRGLRESGRSAPSDPGHAARTGETHPHPTLPLKGRAQEQRQGMFRSEEHTSELQSLMRTSYAVFCL